VVALFDKTVTVGAHFGVVLVLPDGRTPVEVATFRSDQGYSDHRHPDAVEFCSEREDALRRDFTINGLFYDPLEDRVLDYVGGRRDIERRVVRAIGDPEARLSEDRLRMLRGVRFAAGLHFRLDGATFRAIRHHAPGITSVSAERIRDELDRMLTEGDPAAALELMDSTGLLEQVLPEVKALQGVEQPPQFHPEGDVWTHTLLMLQMLTKPRSSVLVWGVLLHDIAKPRTQEVVDGRIRFHFHAPVGARMAEDILRRLRFSAEVTSRVGALVKDHLKFAEVPKMRESTLKRFLQTAHFEDHLELHRVDCLASHGQLDVWRQLRHRLDSEPPEVRRPPRLLSGHDLIAEGYAPGPEFARMLATVEDAQLEGQVTTRDQALALVRAKYPK
jgi:poly(A) polymerase